ncbi:hypothetical protein [Amycolatopsis mediterranei]|uniref:hypothetical protein n=1 Tax=Amycolatopsis mediterranei TaxID=33910 RepID=UPI001E342AAC|nr:hypothetical protein [Amycolatopsis mediterranei]UZF76296.1 hypothetical protein ISP_007457 [Amycolatopsis mediterranei]
MAKGLDVTGMLAELMGRTTGTCRSNGGSMHIADPARHLRANRIVAAGWLIVPAATAWTSRTSTATTWSARS